ncbi:unnamed protein product [Parajaminaea phylloscopi]
MDDLRDALGGLEIRATPEEKARADVLVLRYLERYHASSEATASFRRSVGRSGIESQQQAGGDALDLIELVARHDAALALADQGCAERPSKSTETADQIVRDWPVLSGPSQLDFHVSATFASLHTSNVLVVRSIKLPERRFNTRPADGGEPRFEETVREALLSAGADKRVLIFDPADGEVLDSLEPVGRSHERGHTSAVLDVAQNPAEARELVTAGMDGKVIVWDLIARCPHIVLCDHQRFAVRCAWSPDGLFLATAGYDKKICVYKRSSADNVANQDDDDGAIRPLLSSFELAVTLPTRGNPETICWVEGDTAGTPWLVWSMRDDCFLHYLDVTESILRNTPVESKYNTNVVESDEHISYSILSITTHPSLPLLCLVTGSHASPDACSMVLLMSMFSPTRLATIHTTIAASPTYTPRQAWTTEGTAAGVWVSSEEGRLKLYDLQGRERSNIGVHGAASQHELTGMSSEEKAKRWRMGTMNGLIKDVIALPDGRVVSCGFDRTVRLVSPGKS